LVFFQKYYISASNLVKMIIKRLFKKVLIELTLRIRMDRRRRMGVKLSKRYFVG